jgi:hypothetical protein
MFFNFTARYIASERAGIILPIYVIVKKSHFAIGYITYNGYFLPLSYIIIYLTTYVYNQKINRIISSFTIY